MTASSTSTESWRVEVLAGDLEAAERELRRDYDALEALNERYFRSTVAGLLGNVLDGLGRHAEADEVNHVAESLTAEDDQLSQVLWRLGRAKILARSGQPEEAVALARRAMEIAAETDDLLLQADGALDFGEVLALTGRHEEASARWAEALDLYLRKEDRVSADRVRARLEVTAA